MNLHPFWQKREKTLILRIPPGDWHRAADYTNFFEHCQLIDWRAEVLKKARPTQQRLKLVAQDELSRLQEWADRYQRKPLVVVNTEYFLTKLSHDERSAFWRMFRRMPHLLSIVIYVVLDSPQILPTDLIDWRREGRVLTLGREQREVIFDGIND
jgi:hypothetical protein